LLGWTNGEAIIVTGPGDLSAIDPEKPVELFSQTTKETDQFLQIEKNIRRMMSAHFPAGAVPLKVHNTICGQISGRTPRIREFAGEHDTIIFVGGAQSSNAKVLFGHCRDVNPRSRFVTGPGELKAEWFEEARSAGICGATSTPRWLMEQVAHKIRELAKK
jgi:4-hydroxy-3-methylbut-2-en-1-yl diphosphate reductase